VAVAKSDLRRSLLSLLSVEAAAFAGLRDGGEAAEAPTLKLFLAFLENEVLHEENTSGKLRRRTAGSRAGIPDEAAA